MPDKPQVTGDGRDKGWAIAYFWLGLAGFAGLLAYVLSQGRSPFYDEPFHLERVRQLMAGEPFRLWLVDSKASAVGPVYALMHYAVAGGRTVPAAPWFRVPNVLLLGAIVALIAGCLRAARVPHPWAAALSVLSLPMTWVISGLALTEIPAMAGIAAAIYAATKLGADSRPFCRRHLALLLLIALGVAVGVCGRQTYLVAVPAIGLIGWGEKRRNYALGLAILAGLLPAFALFILWHGLVPPQLAWAGGGVRPVYVVYAAGYAGTAAFLIAPAFFSAHGRWPLAVAIGAVLANMPARAIHFSTFSSAQRLLHNPLLAHGLEWCASQLILAAGAGFAAAVVLELLRGRDRRLAGHAVGVACLCGSCAGIQCFSSLYVSMTVPFLIPLLARRINFGPWAAARLAGGMMLGAVALYSYYRFVA